MAFIGRIQVTDMPHLYTAYEINKGASEGNERRSAYIHEQSTCILQCMGEQLNESLGLASARVKNMPTTISQPHQTRPRGCFDPESGSGPLSQTLAHTPCPHPLYAQSSLDLGLSYPYTLGRLGVNVPSSSVCVTLMI